MARLLDSLQHRLSPSPSTTRKHCNYRKWNKRSRPTVENRKSRAFVDCREANMCMLRWFHLSALLTSHLTRLLSKTDGKKHFYSTMKPMVEAKSETRTDCCLLCRWRRIYIKMSLWIIFFLKNCLRSSYLPSHDVIVARCMLSIYISAASIRLSRVG